MTDLDLSTLDRATTVVVATGNAHKVGEITAILSPRLTDARFVALGDLGSYPDPVEDGATFHDNALIKARAALDETGLTMAVADDSGLCVDALGGAPGIFSARWAGEHGNDDANNDKLLREMADVPEGERTAHFHSSVVFVRRDEDGEEVISGEGDCPGSIGLARRGSHGFGYDPLFVLDDRPGVTMAELDAGQKNQISHRYRALADLAAKL
ncbi:RdgB/HAM1 family non-canonical purine NTP pyrophosphatase [Olsenella massiliensis]|uniref:RdgB/HAM1 family non-canonical purine NTP pyrophosphatase n=1 Tax=Olsenella massiliensis TaxID=1622075 RepID=UPI00071C38CB|nr:RdgB/HAM1 family non-canonical purine NTP pyrophosphatase [Olsenella massiliensis]